jgi:acetaldehyde dehydrogenase (acetylating)
VDKIKAAIIGSGNIGTDLMIKALRRARNVELVSMAGIDPTSDGLARARRLGLATTHDGVEGLARLACFDSLGIVFDATSAAAHVRHDAYLREHRTQIRCIDLTPAAIGPYCVPVVNLDEHLDAPNLNMVTCGGQATIPMVGGGEPRGQGALRRDHRLDFQQERPGRARAPTSTSSPRPPPRPSKWWAARPRARPSSSSTRPSRR